MRLYHFTTQENIWLLSQRGLEPSSKPEVLNQTMGRPAVWLTESMTDRYITEHLQDRTVILAVEAEKHSKKLMHYPKFLRSRGTSIHEFYDPTKLISGTDLNLWWVHFGTIPPHRLGLKVGADWCEIRDAMTAAIALPGIELQIKSARENGEVERQARMMEMREQLMAIPPDSHVTFNSRD